jgi:molybdopterin converting factor small subunit
MKVFFYGRLANAIDPQLDVTVQSPCSVGGLRRQLGATYPELADALGDKRVKALVRETFVGDDHALGSTDEVEFLAPVSGG